MDIVSRMVEVHVFRIVDGEMKFLLIKRIETDVYPNLWQMVSGRIEENEKAYHTALREVFEETGLKAQKMWAVPNVNSFYSPVEDRIILIPVFAVLVDGLTPVILSEEHTAFMWVDKEECKNLLSWIGQRESVDILYDYYFKRKEDLDLVEIKQDNL